MDNHKILMKHYSFYTPLHDTVHKVLLEDEGNGVMWVSYTSLSAKIQRKSGEIGKVKIK